MIEWIVKNKEWLFSGIGGTAIVSLASWAWRLYRDRTRPSMRDVVPTTVSASMGPTIRISPVSHRDICNALRQAPPLQQVSVAQHYVGLWVSWDGYLGAADEVAGNKVRLRLRARLREIPVFHCAVIRSQYPELGILPEDALIKVVGRITSANLSNIELDDVTLSFPTDKPTASNTPNPPTYGDVLRERLFTKVPELKDLPRTRPIEVIAVMNDFEGNRLASEVLEYLKANNYPLKRPILSYIQAVPPHTKRGGSLVERGASDFELIITS